MDQIELSINEEQENIEEGPVECLGKTFDNDEDRRQYYLDLLAEKLKDPEFKKIEGFPIGEDEDILNLSDPPYYTACPNPWIADFITEWESQKIEKEDGNHYHREPFASDVSEGKNHPIYNAHSYHTKVPHRAIMRYILHYTKPGDIVFDGFAGTGMTGVAAQMCGNREEVHALDYVIKSGGEIFEKNALENKSYDGKAFSKIGVRHAILNDLSPAATFIAKNYNASVDLMSFKDKFEKLIGLLKSETSWMWETLHHDNKTIGQINYIVWSDLYSCPECSNEFVYYDQAFIKIDKETRFTPEFNCPHCNCSISKNPKKGTPYEKPNRVFETYFDAIINKSMEKQKQKPVLINYSVGSKRFEKKPDNEDLDKIMKIVMDDEIKQHIPSDKIINGEKSSDPFSCGLKYVHQFYTLRVLVSLGKYLHFSENDHTLNFIFGSILPKLTVMNRYMPQHGSRALVGPMANTLYVPPVCVENNVIDQVIFQYKKIFKALNIFDGSLITTQAAQSIQVPPESIDYIFLDPPFGSNIMYSELSFIRESWLNLVTNNNMEAIESKAQDKNLETYMFLMKQCFDVAYRYLKPGRWMTVEFSNTKSRVWNAIQIALNDAGFIIASINALDKSRGGLHSMLGPTAVKQDLIISAYKPNGGFEERFTNEDNETGVWDFIRTHLGYLPVLKTNGKEIMKIPERDPRILYDQVVAYFVRNLRDVPVSSKEFQEGLLERFSERDGMIFLPEQVSQYDKARITSVQLRQLDIFVDDEASSVEWLRQLLNDKPQTYQDIHPKFINELSGWKKAELQLELSMLLEQNFIKFDGKDQIPPQIHSYLSTNFKDLRNLSKDDSSLLNKAKDRWYVPNPEREEDLQKLRERSLLKQFEDYKTHTGKKIKIIRMEAVRCGFKKAWQERDYATIIKVAEKIPQNLLQEDPKILMWYDQAQTRSDNTF